MVKESGEGDAVDVDVEEADDAADAGGGGGGGDAAGLRD